MRKKKDYDDIHIPFILKELIIVFVIVTFHWVFISFSASEFHGVHVEQSRPLAKTLSLELMPDPSSPLTSSPQRSLNDTIATIDLEDPTYKAQRLSSRVSDQPVSPVLSVGASSDRGLDRVTVRKPSSTDTGGSSSDREVRRIVRRPLLLSQQSGNSSPLMEREGSNYEDPGAREPSVKAHKRTLVLSFPGGGNRALIGAEFMKEFVGVSKELAKKVFPDKEPAGIDLRERATLIAGTSAGGINAISYLMMGETPNTYRYSLGDVVSAYKTEPKIIFDVSWGHRLRNPLRGLRGTIYDKRNLYRVLQDKFRNPVNQQDTTLRDLGREDQHILILALNAETGEPEVFRSALARQEEVENPPAWMVGAGSASAPVYFGRGIFQHAGKTFHLDDGGLYANDPTGFAHHEITKMLGRPLGIKEEDLLFVTIGTGVSDRFNDPDRTQNEGLQEMGIKAIVNAQMTAADKATHRMMKDRALASGFKYYQFQPTILKEFARLDRYDRKHLIYSRQKALGLLGSERVVDLVRDLHEDIFESGKSVLDLSSSALDETA